MGLDGMNIAKLILVDTLFFIYIWRIAMRDINQKGFTLVEVMIVVVIIGIIASIAIPKFTQLINRAKVSEAKSILGQIINLEIAYFYQNSAYFDFDDVDVPEIGYEVPTNAKFTYSYDQAEVFSGETGWATAVEIGDINGNGVTDTDGLKLSIDKTQGVTGTEIYW